MSVPVSRSLCNWLLVSSMALGAPQAMAQTPYTALTNNSVEVPNFMPEPFTGLITDSTGILYAVNPYANLVTTAFGPSPLAIHTGLNPVSIAVVEDRPGVGDRKLLVVSAGTHGLFLHDAITGDVEGFRLLESEPADIVYDAETQLAFVSCQGTNAILQFDPLDLSAAPVRYQISVGERPGYLYLDRGQPGGQDNRIYVAAAVTGNNTITDFNSPANFAVVRSLHGNLGGELDDHDVFVIDPGAQTISPAIKKVGSLLFDLDRFPAEGLGAMWVLATESKNADPELPNEPALNGKFAVNRLKRVGNVVGTTLRTAGAGVDLDDDDVSAPGPQYHSDRSINQARALDFAFGRGYIASPFSDVILEVDALGLRTRELQLPAGSQCYDIEPVGETLYALCLGTMTIESFQILPHGSTPLAALGNPIDLGPDPTPAQVRAGRDVFLEGSLSADGRFSCASCHPRGMSDQLGWQLSNSPSDVKDVMLTQPLVSIADTYPHHWRGERDLLDFQGAFAGLLGAVDEDPAVGSGRNITDDEMEDLVVFIQSLQAPANPNQHVSRQVLDSQPFAPMHNGDIPLTPVPLGSAEQGKIDFESAVFTPGTFGATCADCHTVEAGSNGNLFPVNGGPIPRGFSTEVAHFRQLQNRGRLGKVIGFFDDEGEGYEERVVPVNGFGFNHEGMRVSLRETLDGFITADPMTEQIVANILHFLDQWDQGISPAAHWAIWYDQQTPSAASSIEDYLISGTGVEWNDLAVIGRFRDPDGSMQNMRWWYDPAGTGGFVPEDNTMASWTWTKMQTEVDAGDAEGVFIGLPPGSGKRFAIDFDGDGTVNAQDPAPHVHNAVDDGTAPGVTAVRVDYSTARMAKVILEFSEDVTYSIDYQADPLNGNPPGPVMTVAREDFVRKDTITLPHNEPLTPAAFTSLPLPFDTASFFAQITMQDRFGNSVGPIPLEEIAGSGAPLFVPDPAFPDSFDAAGQNGALHLQHIERMAENVAARVVGVGEVTYTVEIDVRSNYGAPNFILPLADPQVVFLSVAHDLSGSFEKAQIGTLPGQMSTSHVTQFQVAKSTLGSPTTITQYNEEPGPPWIVSPNLVGGDTTISFTVHGLASGTTVRVAVMGIIEECSSGPPVYDAMSLSYFQMLDTRLGESNPTHLDLTVP